MFCFPWILNPMKVPLFSRLEIWKVRFSTWSEKPRWRKQNLSGQGNQHLRFHSIFHEMFTGWKQRQTLPRPRLTRRKRRRRRRRRRPRRRQRARRRRCQVMRGEVLHLQKRHLQVIDWCRWLLVSFDCCSSVLVFLAFDWYARLMDV